MRILRLLMLGVLLVTTAKCFFLSFDAAEDTRDVLLRQRWKGHSFVVHARRTVPTPPALVFASVAAQANAPILPQGPEPMAFDPVDLTPVPDEDGEVQRQSVRPPPPARVRTPHRGRVETPPPADDDEPTAPEDAIRMALRRKRPVFQHCYELELKKQAAFNGFVLVSVTVTQDGRIADAHVEEASRRDAAVGACIVSQLRLLHLGPVSEEAELLIPIRLEAKQEG